MVNIIKKALDIVKLKVWIVMERRDCYEERGSWGRGECVMERGARYEEWGGGVMERGACYEEWWGV